MPFILADVQGLGTRESTEVRDSSTMKRLAEERAAEPWLTSFLEQTLSNKDV